MSRVRLGVLWCLIAIVGYFQARAAEFPFAAERARSNLRLLRHHKKPAIQGAYEEALLDEQLAEWKLTGPISLALPPMYTWSPFGNAGFLISFINHGEVLPYNGPFPHPKLAIHEHAVDGSTSAYKFDDASGNASLLLRIGGDVWPLGYTAWYDVVTRERYVEVSTPHLSDERGRPIEPTAVRAIHPLNTPQLYGDGKTIIKMRHLSPIVWTFPREGSLVDSKPGFVAESIADGTEVSWMPTLPTKSDQPFGMFLLAPRVAPTEESAPAWWGIDQRFRRAVVDGGPIEVRRTLLRQLAAAFPTHPFLTHYRVIAELGSNRFDNAWLEAQTAGCQLPSWYLVAWTHLPWTRVRRLPCVAKLSADALDNVGRYVAEWAVLAFRADRDDAQLQNLAARVIDATFLRTEFRGFNYAPSDFAWLWLKARP